ncbi:MAG: glycosyltransferase family 4 protein [Rhodospirillales bacterium]|jgi:hypothetical protein|nr:glycosyltransferase family 4 protein [Rhodospirillales bacterium]
MKPTLLFVRDFRHFTGGHLKFSHYLNHALLSGLVDPLLYLTPGSSNASDNLFLSRGLTPAASILQCDAFFTAGLDWQILDEAGIETSGRPVINLIQHTRHADPADPRYAFLTRRALRICASPEVALALHATRRVNGEIVTIPYGVDLADSPPRQTEPAPGSLFIGGYKNHDMARALAGRLGGRFNIDLALDMIPREDFLARLRKAAFCILLPHPSEGFFLPAIETMALGVPVIVPDCVGNRSFCRHEATCLMPNYAVDDLTAAALRLDGDPQLAARLRTNGRAEACRQSLESERRQFIDVLVRSLDQMR